MKRRSFAKALGASVFSASLVKKSFGQVLISGSSVVRSGSGSIISVGGSPAVPATLVIDYGSGFAGAGGAFNLGGAQIAGSQIQLIVTQAHNSALAWYKVAKQPPNTFTTQFSFSLSGSGIGSTAQPTGMTFGIQNTVSPPGLSGYVGTSYVGDANMCGCSGAYDQYPPVDAVFIKFDGSPVQNETSYLPGTLPASTGIYMNGGPAVPPGGSLSLAPQNDLVPYGINFYNGHTFAVKIVYDGSLVTLTILDTTSGAQARIVWPLNLANTTNAAGNWLGFTAGTGTTAGSWFIASWQYWSGFNTRLATPTFSPTPGQYAGTQSVTISGPSGAAIYYTTNGLLPTSSSTLYTGAISVPANAVIQAVAIQSGFTDSLVGTGVYKIGTANTINFPSGFSAGALVPAGFAYLSGSAYRVSDTTQATSGAVWFPAPVAITSGWSTTFTLSFPTAGQGMCFVLQNSQPAYGSLTNSPPAWGGGPTVFALGGLCLGYGGYNGLHSGTASALGILNSVAVAFNMYPNGSDPSNGVGVYTGGNTPTGAQTATGLTWAGNTLTVVLSYSGTTLSININSGAFTHSWNVDIPAAVGGITAYAGFVGGTGGAASIQAVTTWKM